MRRFVKIFLAVGLLFAPVQSFAEADVLLGFELGETLEQAKDHAQLNDWQIRPHPSDTTRRLWVIEGANAVLEICQNNVFSITRNYEGGIDEFVALEASVRGEILNGVPETNIFQLHSDGQTSSFIDSEFTAQDGSQTIVRLRSTNGEAKVLTLIWQSEVCSRGND
jgi:hypothetical protein